MKLTLKAPTTNTPGLFGFIQKLPEYTALLAQLQADPKRLWKPANAQSLREMILFFADEPETADEVLNTLSANEIAEALAVIAPQLRELMIGEGMTET